MQVEWNIQKAHSLTVKVVDNKQRRSQKIQFDLVKEGIVRYYVPSKLAVLKNYEFVRRRYSSRKVVALFLIDSTRLRN